MDWDGLLNAGFLGDLLRVGIEVIMTLVGILLVPIGAIIKMFLPDIDSAFMTIPILFDYANTYLGWILNSLAVPGLLLVFMSGYYIFVVSSKLLVWPFKLALSWYSALK